jgi:hypothetical protein
MQRLEEIDYERLIDRIADFPAVKRIPALSVQVASVVAVELAILLLGMAIGDTVSALAATGVEAFGAVGFIFASALAAWIALRNAIPGRETGAGAPAALAAVIAGAALLGLHAETEQPVLVINEVPAAMVREAFIGALPWIAIFWMARRAMPLRPRLIGAATGAAAAAFAIAAELLSGAPVAIAGSLIAGAAIAGLSAIAGEVWLDPAPRWRADQDGSQERAERRAKLILPAAAVLAAALLAFVLIGGGGVAGEPDFDLAIANYRQAMTEFRPNVPSKSLDTVLTAYVEDGMPSYMWDFGPEGYELKGGRFEHLRDGTPVTFTWFRGPRTGVMCMFRQVTGFQAPTIKHYERQHLLFYRYKGYSICLINVGGYGDFVSVIVSPLPMSEFMRIVTRVLI